MTDIDHHLMAPPFIREAFRLRGPDGAEGVLWDFRIGQPNVTMLTGEVLHSLEHMLNVYSREHSDSVVNAAPMGCRTGFHIVTFGSVDQAAMARLIAGALGTACEATAVPRANTHDCGAAAYHSLDEAQEVAQWLLSRRSEWGGQLRPDHSSS
jgi:S-ribosylhomocysteine lyase